jgi:excisionase family DNA binding protein
VPKSPHSEQPTALFVRLPAQHARRLDRAAAALPAHKKDLIAGLVERYVDPESPEGMEALRSLAEPTGSPRRVIVEADDPSLTIGQHAFHATPPPEVLDVDQVAELLAVDRQAILDLAARGELPGREIAGAWRFLRQAVLDWLAAAQ